MKSFVLIPGTIFLLCLWAGNGFAASLNKNVKQGNALFEKGEFNDALKRYEAALKKKPESDVVNFNAGTAYYKNGDYPSALDHLQKALLSDDNALQQKAQYNTGNALYRIGEAQEEQNIDGAVASLEQALGHYERALNLDDKDTDAKYNYDFVKKRLEKLKKNQQQQNQQKQPQQSSDQQKQDQQDQPQDQKDQSQETSQGSRQDQEEFPQEQEQNNSAQSDQQEQEAEDQNTAAAQNQNVQEKEEQGGQAQDQREMTQKEAQRFLQNYQQSEEPRGLLNLTPHHAAEKPVIKDW